MGLGQMIGKVEDNLSVTNSADEQVKLRVFYDFSAMSDNDVKVNLVGSGTRIAFQRVLRAMKSEDIKALDGTTIDACSAGKKVKSDEQVKAEYMARFNSSDKTTQAEMIANLQAQMGEVESDEVESDLE